MWNPFKQKYRDYYYVFNEYKVHYHVMTKQYYETLLKRNKYTYLNKDILSVGIEYRSTLDYYRIKFQTVTKDYLEINEFDRVLLEGHRTGRMNNSLQLLCELLRKKVENTIKTQDLLV